MTFEKKGSIQLKVENKLSNTQEERIVWCAEHAQTYIDELDSDVFKGHIKRVTELVVLM